MRRNVVGYVALFFALGGIAGAAAQPLLDKPGTVDSSHISSGAVKDSDIASGAVGEKELDPSLRNLSEMPVLDGTYSGSPTDNSTVVRALVTGGQVVDLEIVGGDCAWDFQGGDFDGAGRDWSYFSSDDERHMLLRVEGQWQNQTTLGLATIATATSDGSEWVWKACEARFQIKRGA